MQYQYNQNDQFNRVVTIIDSCLTFDQLSCCLTMIFNIKSRHKIDIDPLIARVNDKRQEIYLKKIGEV